MLRRLLREQIRLVQDGGDPIGTVFDESKAFFVVGGGLILTSASPSRSSAKRESFR